MKTTLTIILFFLPFLLHSQWQETEYGFISKDSTYGNIKYDSNFEAITFESNQSMTVFDLELGQITNRKLIDNKKDSHTVTTYNLEYQYQMFTVLNNPGIEGDKVIQPIKIYKKQDCKIVNTITDTLRYDYKPYQVKGAVDFDFKLIDDSLLIINLRMLQLGEQEEKSNMSFIYNLESKVSNPLSGKFYSYRDYSPNTGMIFTSNTKSVQSYNPYDYSSSTSYHFYKLGESKSKYYNKDKLNLRNIVLPNMSNNFIVFNDNGYFLESFNNDDRIERKTTKYLNMNAKFSEFDDFLILHDNTNNQNVFHILNYENNKILETIQLDYNLKLNFIKHKDEYLYCRSENGKILKIYIPFFDTGNLVCDFQTDKDIYFTGEEIEFYDKTSGYPNKWLWDFGDNKFSTNQHPTHIYNEPSLYTITLIVENENGLKDTLTKEKAVSIVPKLIADFEFEIVSENPNTIKFTNKSIGEIKDYIWNFGDGTIVNDVNPTQVFNDNNRFASLTVLDELGNFDQKVVEVNTDNNIIADNILDIYPLPTFTTLQLPTNADLTDVEFVNEKIGLITSASGEIFRTSDGGVSWNLTTKFTEPSPTRIRILPSKDIIISTFSGVLYKSFDYGISWIIFSELSDKSTIVDFDCKNYDECFLISELNEINKTNKSGVQETKNKFEINLRFDFTGTVKNQEPLTSILSHNNEYISATEATYYKGDYQNGYFHTLIKTNDFNRYDAMIDLDFLYGSKGNINEINIAGYNDLLFIENGKYLFTHKLGSPSIINKLMEINNFSDKFYSDSNIIILPTRGGDIYLLDSLVFDKFFPKFRVRIVNIDDSPIFDYHQISSDLGIAIGEGGKYYITDFTTDVETNENTTKLDIYPNPVNNVFTIRFNRNEYIRSIEIYTTTGERVRSKQYNEYTNFINHDIENFGKGVYFLKIITNNNTFYRKIVKF